MAKMQGDTGRYRWFRKDRCRQCGACLMACPVVHLPQRAARYDRERAIHGLFGESLSLSLCTTCNACDLVCPEGAGPYELVLERFDEESRLKGLPGMARMVFPNEDLNLWSLLRPLMSDREAGDLEQWASNLSKKHRAVMLTGFYTNLVPFLLQGDLFGRCGMPVAGSEGLWGCGGDSHKLGLIGVTERVARLLEAQFASMNVEKVVCFMEAEAAMLSEVLPGRYGARFPFEVEPLGDWLRDGIARGKIEIKNPLGMNVTVHDNCMSRCLEGRPQEVMRSLMKDCGCSVVEMEHSRERALCCGWAATIPSLFSGAGLAGTFMHMIFSLNRRLGEAIESGADAVVTGCPACYIFLSFIRYLTNRTIDVYHTVEIVRMAAGETPAHPAEERCLDLLAAVAMLAWRSMRDPDFTRRFRPSPPVPGRVTASPPLGEDDARRIKRIRRLIGGRLLGSRAARVLMGWFFRGAASVYGFLLKHERARFIRSVPSFTCPAPTCLDMHADREHNTAMEPCRMDEPDGSASPP
jgi:Fe-S oxidoreductase